MPRVTKIIDASLDEVESAKETAVALIQEEFNTTALDLFYSDNLSEVETGIKNLNSFSSKSWLVSSILLYTLIYSKDLYTQSGLSWADYAKQSRERLGLNNRDISEQLSAARFFIRHHEELARRGFNPIGNNRKLSRAELATDLCGDFHLTIEHLINDDQNEFIAWYQSFKAKKAIPATDFKRNDIEIKKDKFFIQGKEAVSISDEIPEGDKMRIEKYIKQIFEALQLGYEPAIIQCYDEKEGRALLNLRDKYRQKR